MTGSFNATSDPSELKRTWDAAHVYLPTDGLDVPNALKLTGPGGSSALRRLRIRRLRKASEEFPMAATAQNLKRLVKHLRRMDAPPTMATT
jgi:hypothetical protein